MRPVDFSSSSDPKVQAALQALAGRVDYNAQAMAQQHAQEQAAENQRMERAGLEAKKAANLEALAQFANQSAQNISQGAARENEALASQSPDKRRADNLQTLAQFASSAAQGISQAQGRELEISAAQSPDKKRGDNLQALAQMASNAANETRAQAGKEIEAAAAKRPESELAASLQMLAKNSQGQPTQARLCKNALNGGEISPLMAARFDLPKVRNGASKMLNLLPLPAGGATRRPGFSIIGDAHANSILWPFIFSASESRVLELYFSGATCRLAVWNSSGKMGDYDIGLPFSPDNLAKTTFCQSADVIFYANPELPPGKIMRYADNDWRHAVINWGSPVPQPSIKLVERRGSTTSNPQAYVLYQYTITAIDKDTGAESMPSILWGFQYLQMSSTFYNVVMIDPWPDYVAEYRVYRRQAGVWGFIGRMTEGATEFEDKNYEPDTSDTPPNYKNPFDGPGNYPAVVFLHQQRLGYAATNNKPMTVWLSESGNLESMASSTPPQDDNAIEATLAANQANRILWALSDRNSLAIGTEGGEWILRASDGSAITPKDLSFEPQTSHGSQPGINPLRVTNGILFCQRGGRVTRQLGYSFQDDRYTAQELTLLAPQMFESSRIKKWVWRPEPDSAIWHLAADGNLRALTWLPEQEVIAWSRHETNAQILDIESIPEDDGEWRLFALAKFNDQYKMCVMNRWNGSRVDAFGAQSARLVPYLPEAGQETFTAARKINSFKCRVWASDPFQAIAYGGKAEAGRLMRCPSDQTITACQGMAEWACHIASGWRDMASLELIFDDCANLTILGLEFNVEMATSLGNQ